MKSLIQKFIKATNAFDVEAAIALFAHDAVIDDVSVGDTFVNTAGDVVFIGDFLIPSRAPAVSMLGLVLLAVVLLWRGAVLVRSRAGASAKGRAN